MTVPTLRNDMQRATICAVAKEADLAIGKDHEKRLLTNHQIIFCYRLTLRAKNN